MALTPEQRAARAAELKAAREKAYFESKASAEEEARAKAPPLPEPDAYIYSYVWRQDVGAPTGELKLVKTPNPYYNPNTNEVTDPDTGKKTPATPSMWTGPTTFRGDGTATTGSDVKGADGLTPAQREAAAALAQAKADAKTLAEKLGAQVDPNTGKVITSTIDPTKAAEWYATEQAGSTGKPTVTKTTSGTGSTDSTGGTGGTGGSGTKTTPTTPATTYTAPDGRIFTSLDAYNAYLTQTKQEESARVNRSAYDLLYQQFAKYGLQALVTPLESLIKEGIPASEFAIRLRDTDAYQKRFAANKARINKGLAALSEAEYINLEDQYQNIMRNYGMPESYYKRGDMGRQEGFEKLIAGDVSAAELETRVSSAYNRVINSNPEVLSSLKSFYPNITNGDILAYALDPDKALTDINKKITAAEIGGAALGAGLGIDVARAEQLGAFGVSKAQAQQGYQNIAEFLPSAAKLGEIYAKQGLGPYSQATAETEMFGISGAADAAKKRKQLTQLETAQFSGQVGAAGGALGRERAGQF